MTLSSSVSLAIIGSGPAGYTAAIYAARAGLSVVLFQGSTPGGQLTTTTMVENYPGYPMGVLGPKMMEDLEAQARRFGTVIENSTVVAVDFTSYPFVLTIEDGQKIAAQSVVVATGASAKWLGLPAEQKLHGRGVSACATCDGFFFKGQAVAVVGGGDTAAEEALYLANLCKQVAVLVRGDKMRASYILQERMRKKDNITIRFNTTIQEILGEESLVGLQLFDKDTKAIYTLPVEGLFIAIGHQPNTTLFATSLDLDAQGYIKTQPGTTQTNIPGVFAAGDVQDPYYRQAVTAAGTGCMAALAAEKFIAGKNA